MTSVFTLSRGGECTGVREYMDREPCEEMSSMEGRREVAGKLYRNCVLQAQ